MELLQLKYFCHAAETQNFSKTAKKFLVPPSNISQTIKRLEKELGTPLFERRANKIKLCESGQNFYKNVKPALELIEKAETSLKSTPKIETIKINIHITRRVVMETIEDYRKQHPEIYFITTHNVNEPPDDFDIIVTDKQFLLPYKKSKVADEGFRLAYNKNSFVLKESISPTELKNLPFITMNSGSSIFENTKKICKSLGFSPNIVLQSEDPFYIRKCIELGLGVSVVPENSWSGQFSENISYKKISPIKREIFVYKKHRANDNVNEFFSMLINNFNS